MKKSIFLSIALFFSLAVMAQGDFLVKKSAKGLYVTHVVAPKEGLYSVGRMYNVHPKELASFNGLDVNTGLNIGQVIQVPLTAVNFSQERPSSKPLYYVVGDKEGLMRVSANNNDVLLANLRKWNNLSSDNIKTGQRLIVGFLIGEGEVPAATVATITPAPREQEAAPVAKTEPVEEKRKPVALQEEYQEKPATRKQEPTKADVSKSKSAPAENGDGYFRSQFVLQTRVQALSVEETITAGIFKTASGWQDGKYYALIDNVEPGTIVKLINPENNKAIYAKVLDKMSGIRQNAGYDLRMSNAAAVALDIAETDKFFVKLVY